MIFMGEERSLTMVFMGGQVSRFVAIKSEHNGNLSWHLGDWSETHDTPKVALGWISAKTTRQPSAAGYIARCRCWNWG